MSSSEGKRGSWAGGGPAPPLVRARPRRGHAKRAAPQQRPRAHKRARGAQSKALKEGDANLAGEHLREGLAAVLAVRVPSPEFEGQTKTRLGNPEVRKLVDGVVAAGLADALEAEPAVAAAVLGKALQAARAAEAARKARPARGRPPGAASGLVPAAAARASCAWGWNSAASVSG